MALDWLLPLVERPAWGERIAKRMFLGDDALWNPSRALRSYNTSVVEELADSRLLEFAPVRESLSSAMRDHTVVGQVWSAEDGGPTCDLGDIPTYPMGGNGRTRRVDPRDPVVGAKVALRVCDVVGFTLESLEGSPEFRPYWSIKDRDAALEQMIAYVKNEGRFLARRRPFARGRDVD